MYRGILMPFSSDDETIDFVFGVINWKELADDIMLETLEQEVSEALRTAPAPRPVAPIWADGPSSEDQQLGYEGDTGIFPSPDEPLDLSGMEAPTEDAPLADWLALARDGADLVRASEARSHAALYRAIGLAYDFALVAKARPDDYAELLADTGIKVQTCSPMTAIIKLVFGTTYDKTRITEYATALDHGLTAGLNLGSLASYLSAYDGGLKGLIRDERAQRRALTPVRPDRRQSARDAMKVAIAIDPVTVTTDMDGLAVVIARREADGTLAIVAALPEGSELGQKVMIAAAH